MRRFEEHLGRFSDQDIEQMFENVEVMELSAVPAILGFRPFVGYDGLRQSVLEFYQRGERPQILEGMLLADAYGFISSLEDEDEKVFAEMGFLIDRALMWAESGWIEGAWNDLLIVSGIARKIGCGKLADYLYQEAQSIYYSKT